MRQMQVPELANDILDDIRRSVEDESLSFILGAGFSRNVSKRFPLWDELLKPIAEELYPGYHEAIDLHIEKVVPYLRRRDAGVSESYKKKLKDYKKKKFFHLLGG